MAVINETIGMQITKMRGEQRNKKSEVRFVGLKNKTFNARGI